MNEVHLRLIVAEELLNLMSFVSAATTGYLLSRSWYTYMLLPFSISRLSEFCQYNLWWVQLRREWTCCRGLGTRATTLTKDLEPHSRHMTFLEPNKE